MIATAGGTLFRIVHIAMRILTPIESGRAMTDVTSRLQCAGLNRLEVEDESSLRERSSDPLGLESCAATARDTVKRRQRIGGVGIQLRKDAIRTPTSL